MSQVNNLPPLFKEAFSMLPTGPTVGDLLSKVSSDPGLPSAERGQVLQQLRRELGPVSPSTPLKSLLPSIGGGVLGYLIAKYFSMGTVGQAVSTMAGYGIGKTVGQFFNAVGDMYYNRSSQDQFRRW